MNIIEFFLHPDRQFWTMMIILDLFIALWIPAWRVIKRLRDPKIIEEITENYGNGVFDAIKPKVEDVGNKFIDKIKSEVITRVETNINVTQGKIEQKIHDEVSTAITNDIPHIIDSKLKPFEGAMQYCIENVQYAIKEIQDAKSMMGSTLSASRNIKKKQRDAERFMKMQHLIELDPKLERRLEMGYGIASMQGGSMKDFDKTLDGLIKIKSMKSTGGTSLAEKAQKMSSLWTDAFQPIQSGQMRTDAWEDRVMEGSEKVTEEDVLNELYAKFPKERVELAKARREKVLAESKKLEELENGTKEKEKR